MALLAGIARTVINPPLDTPQWDVGGAETCPCRRVGYGSLGHGAGCWAAVNSKIFDMQVIFLHLNCTQRSPH